MSARDTHLVCTAARALTGVRRFARRFRGADRGGVAMLTALALPPLLLVGLGAVQVQAVVTDRSRTQDVADAAALWGAQQLTVTPTGAEDRTEAWANAQLDGVKANATVTVNAEVVGPKTIKVTIDTSRPSFFFNLMPMGGFATHAEAVAEGATINPLCVINFGTATSDKAEVTNTSRLTAPKCLIHVNERLEVAGSALLQAKAIEAGAGASGPMNPSADIGAPDVDDPFSDLDIQGAGALGCLVGAILTPVTVANGATLELNPGSYCGYVTVNNGATLRLKPGEYYFNNGLELKMGANLEGENVVLVFGPNGVPKWKDGASVVLAGRRIGRMAGFVIATTRNRGNELKIEADSVDELTGTIYVPTATLNIEGNGQAAQASDWTVMAVKALKLSGAPQVQINANYSGSDVPVPGGVGNKVAHTKLTQ